MEHVKRTQDVCTQMLPPISGSVVEMSVRKAVNRFTEEKIFLLQTKARTAHVTPDFQNIDR